MDESVCRAYIDILKEELIPATGCTEPIAIAYAAAKARETLGLLPENCIIEVSGNIIKNVKSVVVPNTGGLKGIEAAAAAGITVGNASQELLVLEGVAEEAKKLIAEFLTQCHIEVVPSENGKLFYIRITLSGGGHSASVAISDFHTNITLIERDGQLLHKSETVSAQKVSLTDRSVLNVKDICEFADTVDVALIYDTIKRQIDCNTAIAQDGMTGSWGASIGRTLMDIYGDSVGARAKAAAAAGSDARMGGCEKPVVIVSGSGNQGMTASLPVIEYAKELNVREEKLIRALALSNLITIHQKTGIGRLSAFCGAVSAGCGAASGIAYLYGGDYVVVAHTIVNTLAIVSGMVCDGAKPSCAAKIGAAVDAGILGYNMYMHGHEFISGEGIVKKGVENTINNVGRLAREGMRETDREILDIMVGR